MPGLYGRRSSGNDVVQRNVDWREDMAQDRWELFTLHVPLVDNIEVLWLWIIIERFVYQRQVKQMIALLEHELDGDQESSVDRRAHMEAPCSLLTMKLAGNVHPWTASSRHLL